jgi:hypothetical protein
MAVGQVTAIHRYPVKSMGGESLQSARLAEAGMAGDRAWAVRDEVRGGIRGAKKIPRLMELSARYEKTPAETGSSAALVSLPSGETLSTTDPDAASRISQAIDHEISLWPLLPADALDHYRRGSPTHEDFMEELRSIFGREPDEPLPDIGRFPPELLEYESPPGTYFDAYPLLILSQQSLDQMQEVAPDSRFDARRFRPNLVVDSPGADPFPELAWQDKRLRVGGTVLQLTTECPRCVMTTHGFADLPRDPKIMRSLVQHAGGNLGVYARVEEPGEVRVGDELQLLT